MLPSYHVDLITAAIFLLIWQGYEWRARRLRSVNSLSGLMDQMRTQWMRTMLGRSPRIMDAQLQSALLAGVGFFASTTIVAIGGLLAMIGNIERLSEVLEGMGLSSGIPWTYKLVAIAMVFVYAFFQFAWAYRLFNYLVIMMGAQPDPIPKDQLDTIANRLGRMHAVAALHFSSGLRAFYFAIALISWLAGDTALIVVTLLITLLLYWRDDKTPFLRVLREFD